MGGTTLESAISCPCTLRAATLARLSGSLGDPCPAALSRPAVMAGSCASGADVTAVVADGETQYQYEKDIKYKGRTVTRLKNIQVDSEGIVNIEQLASDIQQGLITSSDEMVDAAYKNGLTIGSARLSRYMLEGEPKVEFSLGGEK